MSAGAEAKPDLAKLADVVQLSEPHKKRLAALFTERTAAWEALRRATLAQQQASAYYNHVHGKAMGGLEAILPDYEVNPDTAIWEFLNGEVIVQRPPEPPPEDPPQS